MKAGIGSLVLAVSLVCGSALAGEVREPSHKVEQTFKVSPQSYASASGLRGSVQLAQQEIALQLWQSNRALTAAEIMAVGARAEQQFRVAATPQGAGGKLVNGASQK